MAIMMKVTVMMAMLLMGKTWGVQQVPTRRYQDTVTLTGMALPSTLIDSTMTVSSICECRMSCFVMTRCHSATAKVAADGILCQWSSNSVSCSSLIAATDSYTFYWSEYVKHGERYYRVQEQELPWFQAKKCCLQEGGQLAVVDTPEKMTEFTAALQTHNSEYYSVSIFATREEMTAAIGPFWEYASGYRAKVETVRRESPNRCFMGTLENGNWVFNNREEKVCDTPLPFVCQRSSRLY